jgi:hypothetical protein
LWLLAAALLVVAQLGRLTPTVFPDEWVWGRLAENLAAGEGYVYRGATSAFRSLYPFVIFPAWTALDGEGAYRAALAINAFVMTATILPAYALARRLASTPWALAAAGAAVITPAMVWAGMLMTEALAYPLAALALWRIVETLAQPGRRSAALALGAILLASAVRPQLLVLLLVLALALAVDLIRRGRAGVFERLRQHRALVVALAAVCASGLVMIAAGREDLAIGAYSRALDSAQLGTLGGYALDYVGVVTVVSLGLPVVALFVLACRSESWRDHRLGPLLATSCAAVVVFALVGAWSSATVSPELRERYVFYATPALTACWAALPGRVSWRPVVVATAFLALGILATFSGFEDVTDAAVRDSLGSLVDSLVGSDLGLTSLVGSQAELFAVAVAALGGFAAIGLAASRRLGAIALVVPMLAFGVLVIAVRQREANRESAQRSERALSPLDWVDRVVDGPVASVRLRGAEPETLFELELWNQRIDRAFSLETEQLGEVGSTCTVQLSRDKRIQPPRDCPGGGLPRYLLFIGPPGVRSVEPGRQLGMTRDGVALYEIPARSRPRVVLDKVAGTG